MKNIINFIIKEDDNNKRVDTILANHDKSLSRTRVKNLILDSKLKINEKIIQDPSIKTKSVSYTHLTLPTIRSG